jgi:hypothetical protein
MSDATLVFNGIDGTTGEYLLPPLTAHQVSRLAQGYGIDDEQRQELRDRHFGLQPTYAVKEGVDPNELAQTGWGAVFAHGADPAIKDALGELLALRREQAGDRFRVFEGADAYRPGESKDVFLKRHGMGPGPADPDRVPYYLLLVGDPDAIPYRFQYQLDVQYAVGRVHFDTLEEYARYARSVVSAERDATRPRTAVFFGVRNAGDPATGMSADDLVAPLATTLGAQFGAMPNAWNTTLIEPADATRARLLGLLGGEETPAFLFTASHGVGFAANDPRQMTQQGALLCQDWPGPEHPGRLEQAHYVAADDIDDEARLLGLIAFHFACYGAGTPRLDDFAHLAGGNDPAIIANRAFVAPLPRRLLAHPRGGALAVIGHVERAWGCSIRWQEAGAQIEAFRSTLHRLLDGHRVGSALEPMNGRYAEISTDLATALQNIRFGQRPDDQMLAWMWTANNDARAYAVVGDPAVRLSAGDGGGAQLDIEPVTAIVTPVPRPVDPIVVDPAAVEPTPATGQEPASMAVGERDGKQPSIAAVIEQVKQAIRLVERVAARPVGATIERVELTIQTVLERGAGGALALNVPVLGEVGGGGGVSRNQTQVVTLTLRPVEQIEAFDAGDVDVELRLTTAILDLRDAVRAAASSSPRFQLDSAAIELRFVVTREGHITLIARGERADEVTHTLTLHIAGPRA